MIREAEPKDQAAIEHLYEILAPGAPIKILFLLDRINRIDTDSFIGELIRLNIDL